MPSTTVAGDASNCAGVLFSIRERVGATKSPEQAAGLVLQNFGGASTPTDGGGHGVAGWISLQCRGYVCNRVQIDTNHDAELWSEINPPSSRRLLAAALDCFAERGYHATTTRQIATRAGLSPGAVYVHFPSKAELLYRISLTGHMSALAAFDGALDDDVTNPIDRIDHIVRAFAGWHARHHRLARVVQYELDSIPPERRREIVRLRARFQARVERELANGVREGVFAPIDVEGSALAILSLCIDIARWYGPSSRRTPAALGGLYADFVCRALREDTLPVLAGLGGQATRQP
jgi:AcrR family transcriptional regulator